jgi:hypothetical protein
MTHEHGQPEWNDTDSRKLQNTVKNLSQCNFIHHKSHMASPRLSLDVCRERPAINCLSHGTTNINITEKQVAF